MITQELISQIKDKVICGTDIGINIEIEEFFGEWQNVDVYNISIINGKTYKILVKLKKFNIYEAKRMFSEFLCFIEYPSASFYTRTNREEFIEYNLLSFNEDMRGFYCEIQIS